MDEMTLIDILKLNYGKTVNMQLIVAKHTKKALAGWWRSSHLSGILYLQRGAILRTANMDEKEKRYEFWQESSVFTPA